jgi:Ubiquitin carboxyl-terminal hydrolase
MLICAMLWSKKCFCVQLLANVPEFAIKLLSLTPVQDADHAAHNAEIVLCIQKAIASIHQPGAEGHFFSIDALLKLLPEDFNGVTEQCVSDFLHYLLSVFDKGFPEVNPMDAMMGTMKLTLKCKCGHSRSRYEKHTIVPLSIPSDGCGKPLQRTSVQQMVDNLSRFETVKAENCSCCGKNTPVRRRSVFSQKSSVLVMCISIFEWDSRFESSKKLLCDITIQNTVSIRYDDGNDCKTLALVIFHLGEDQESGHYVVRLKGPDGRWYQADDKCVTGVNDHHIDSKIAVPYILVYKDITGPLPVYPFISTLASRFEFYPLKIQTGYSLFLNHFSFSFPSYHELMPYVN